MKFCENVTMIAVGRQPDKNAILTRVRCKMWSCEYCARINRTQWQLRIIRTIEKIGVQGWAFVTVTVKSQSDNADVIIKKLQSGLSKLLKRMRRANIFDDMPYIRVYERGSESGRWHAHLLVRFARYAMGDYYGKNNDILIDSRHNINKSNTKWVKDSANKCLLGYIADYKTIVPESDAQRDIPAQLQQIFYVVSYIVKYMSKDIQEVIQSEKPKNLRVIQSSREFKPEYATDVDADELAWSVQTDYTFQEFVETDKMQTHDVQRETRVKLGDFAPVSGNYLHVQIVEHDDEEALD